MSCTQYKRYHQSEENKTHTDSISLDDVSPGNKYKTITYTRFNILGNYTYSPVKTVYWNVDTAKEWFSRSVRDPETNVSIFSYHTFSKRLSRQVQLSVHYSPDFEPDNEYLTDLFMRYKKYKEGESLTEGELCLLHNFFHMDNAIFKDLDRERAEELLTNTENGSWVLRKTSVKDSNVIATRAITYKDNKGHIYHTLIANIYGHGYVITSGVSSGDEMPNVGSGGSLSFKQSYASFIDLIDCMPVYRLIF
jgi:hypothetical protein